MEKLVTRIMAIASVIVLAFNGVDYIRKEPTTLSLGIEQKLDKEIAGVRRDMDDRKRDRDKEIVEIRDQIKSATTKLMDKLEKMDDRLYELQKHQREARIRNGEVLVEDI
jgi:ATP-dependent protease ClpP protease subunit